VSLSKDPRLVLLIGLTLVFNIRGLRVLFALQIGKLITTLTQLVAEGKSLFGILMYPHQLFSTDPNVAGLASASVSPSVHGNAVSAKVSVLEEVSHEFHFSLEPFDGYF